MCCDVFFFQAEDGIRDLVRSRGLGDVYKRQMKIVCKDIQSYEMLLFKKLSAIEEVERLKTLMNLSVVKSSNKLPIHIEDLD